MADTEQDLGTPETPTDTTGMEGSGSEETDYPTIEPRQEDEDIPHHRPEHEPLTEDN